MDVQCVKLRVKKILIPRATVQGYLVSNIHIKWLKNLDCINKNNSVIYEASMNEEIMQKPFCRFTSLNASRLLAKSGFPFPLTFFPLTFKNISLMKLIFHGLSGGMKRC